MSRPSHFAYLHPRPRFRWGLNQKFLLPAFLSSIPLPSSFCLLCIPLQEAWLLSLAFFAYPMHTPVYTCTHTHTVVVTAMKRMCLCWIWPVACIPCRSELPSSAFHKRVPGLRKATGMSPSPCSGLASPFPEFKKIKVSERYVSLSKPC